MEDKKDVVSGAVFAWLQGLDSHFRGSGVNTVTLQGLRG